MVAFVLDLPPYALIWALVTISGIYFCLGPWTSDSVALLALFFCLWYAWSMALTFGFTDEVPLTNLVLLWLTCDCSFKDSWLKLALVDFIFEFS